MSFRQAPPTDIHHDIDTGMDNQRPLAKKKYVDVPGIKVKSFGSPSAKERKELMAEALNMDGNDGANFSPLHKGISMFDKDG